MEFGVVHVPKRDPARYLDAHHDGYDDDDQDDDGLEFDAPPVPSPGVVTGIGAALLGILIAVATAPVSG